METIIEHDQEQRLVKISKDQKTKTQNERNLIVLRNRLGMAGDKAKFIDPKSLSTAMAMAEIFRDEISKAADNGGSVDFKSLSRSVSEIAGESAGIIFKIL